MQRSSSGEALTAGSTLQLGLRFWVFKGMCVVESPLWWQLEIGVALPAGQQQQHAVMHGVWRHACLHNHTVCM
jgi:hypothetical protein